MAELETIILLPWQPTYPKPYTEIAFQVNRYLYKKSGPSTPSDSWDIEISLCCHGKLFLIATKIAINSLVNGVFMHRIWPSYAFKWLRYWPILLILHNLHPKFDATLFGTWLNSLSVTYGHCIRAYGMIIIPSCIDFTWNLQKIYLNR